MKYKNIKQYIDSNEFENAIIGWIKNDENLILNNPIEQWDFDAMFSYMCRDLWNNKQWRTMKNLDDYLYNRINQIAIDYNKTK